MQVFSPAVHWTTYVQTFAIIASTIGTFVYVYFTYHIMKWAVAGSQATMDVAKMSLSRHSSQSYDILSELVRSLGFWWEFIDRYETAPIEERAKIAVATMDNIRPSFERTRGEGLLPIAVIEAFRTMVEHADSFDSLLERKEAIPILMLDRFSDSAFTAYIGCDKALQELAPAQGVDIGESRFARRLRSMIARGERRSTPPK